MSNRNERAFPQHPESRGVYMGLTKREYFAAMAVQGLMASPHVDGATYEEITEAAVNVADALLKELEK